MLCGRRVLDDPFFPGRGKFGINPFLDLVCSVWIIKQVRGRCFTKVLFRIGQLSHFKGKRVILYITSVMAFEKGKAFKVLTLNFMPQPFNLTIMFRQPR